MRAGKKSTATSEAVMTLVWSLVREEMWRSKCKIKVACQNVLDSERRPVRTRRTEPTAIKVGDEWVPTRGIEGVRELRVTVAPLPEWPGPLLPEDEAIEHLHERDQAELRSHSVDNPERLREHFHAAKRARMSPEKYEIHAQRTAQLAFWFPPVGKPSEKEDRMARKALDRWRGTD